jgi:hypothetical protein
MKRTILFLSVFFGLALGLASRARAATVTLDWDAVTTNSDGSAITDLSGYTVYQSTVDFATGDTCSGNTCSGGTFLTTTTVLGKPWITPSALIPAPATTFNVTGLVPSKTYYFRLIALNSSNMQSGFNVNANDADVEVTTTTTAGNACDINSNGTVDGIDVGLEINAALAIIPCTPIMDIQPNSSCDGIDVQRIINAALGVNGGACVTQ